MSADGTILDKKGRAIGKAGDFRKVATDKNGNTIGYVDEHGRVVDEKGKIVGFIDKNGNVVKAGDTVIGKTCVRKKVVYNRRNQIIGFVEANGTVKDFKNKVIGSDKNGDVADTKGILIGKTGIALNVVRRSDDVVIGYVDDKNYVRGNENKIAGLVDLKGNVLAVRENIIGKLDADKKTLRDKGGEIIGYMKTIISLLIKTMK